MNRARGSESRRPRTLDPPEPECSSEAYALVWVLFRVFRARAPNMVQVLMIPRGVVPKAARELVIGAEFGACRSRVSPVAYSQTLVRFEAQSAGFFLFTSGFEKDDPASSWSGRGRELVEIMVR